MFEQVSFILLHILKLLIYDSLCWPIKNAWLRRVFALRICTDPIDIIWISSHLLIKVLTKDCLWQWITINSRSFDNVCVFTKDHMKNIARVVRQCYKELPTLLHRILLPSFKMDLLIVYLAKCIPSHSAYW